MVSLFANSARADCCWWGAPAWTIGPAEYNYDGYKPPPMYYRAYYGDYWRYRVRVHRRAHVVRSRG